MKLLFGLSLVLNVWLAFLYWKASKRPVLERIVVEKVKVKERGEKVVIQAPSRPKSSSLSDLSGSPDPDPVFAEKAEDLQHEAEDLETLRKDFFEHQEISEKVLRRKDKIMHEFFQKSAEIYQKHPTGITMSFEERRRLIDLEEEAQKKVRALFTPRKWEEYKNFVNSHNKKVIEGTKTGESTGVLMGY